MKKQTLVILALILSTCLMNAQFTKVGGGFGYTTGYTFQKEDYDFNRSGNFNFSGMGVFEINLPFHIAPSITFFLPHVWKESTPLGTSKVTVTTLMIDVNGHYVFNSPDRFEFYGLAGLDILLAWKNDHFETAGTDPLEDSLKETDNALGLNLGLGTYIKITESLDLNIEARYLLSKYQQLMVNAGILINLQPGQK